MINEKRLIDIFLELASVNSPSWDERKRADILVRIFKDAGITLTEYNSGARGTCGNLYAYLPGELPLTPLLFSSHLDTIGSWPHKNIIRENSGRITTDGKSILGADDCSGLAAITEAVLAITAAKKPRRPIELLFTVAEEVYCGGMDFFPMDIIRAKEAYVFDLTGEIGRAAVAAPSILGFSCKFIGREAHAGFEPEAGVSAIRAAAAAVLNMPYGRVEDTTVNIGLINGGSATNVVPGLCELTGEVRSLDHEKAVRMRENLLNIARDTAAQHGAGFESAVIENARAYRTDEKSNAAERFKDACRACGVTPRLIETFGGSDLNELCKAGITGVVCACGMQLCHGTREYTNEKDLLSTAKIAFNLMASEK